MTDNPQNPADDTAHEPPATPGPAEPRADVKAAWKEAGERLSMLGTSLKTRYDERRAATPEPAADAAPDHEPAAGGTPAPARDQFAEAAHKVTSAVQEAFEAMGTAARDPEVKDEARQVGRSLVTALSATFAEISDDLRRAADKGKPPAG
jgi:hypothetical protein